MKSVQTITLESVTRTGPFIDFRYDFADIGTVHIVYFPDSYGSYFDFRVTSEGDYGIGYEGAMRHNEAISAVLNVHHLFKHNEQVGGPR